MKPVRASIVLAVIVCMLCPVAVVAQPADADLDHSGKVDHADLMLFIQQWQQETSGDATPTPTGGSQATATPTDTGGTQPTATPTDADTPALTVQRVGGFRHGTFDEGAAEIVDFCPQTDRVFVLNAETNKVDILDASVITNLTKINELDLSQLGAGPNSVAVHDGIAWVAIENATAQDPGVVAAFNTSTLALLASFSAGALPDMVGVSPDGNWVAVANEGEPDDDYTVDPEGSVTLIDISGGLGAATVHQLGFSHFNSQLETLRTAGVRIFGPSATVAMDLEPEYIAFTPDSQQAFVACQENNAFAVVDLTSVTATAILPLGTKDHSVAGYGLDPSNRDDGINIATHPVLGFYMPDGIAAYEVGGQSYIVSANEGDARDYDGYSEETRIKDLTLDPAVYPNAATLQADEVLGRLKTTTADGDTDNDGDVDQLYCYGSRSFSIWSTDGTLVFDSGDRFEQQTATAYPDYFNSDNDENSFDSRSDDKGPEPEGVAIGWIEGRAYAFVGLERVGGIMMYDITNPQSPAFVQYIQSRDFTVDVESPAAGDIAPEGLHFVPAADSPSGNPLVIVGYEVSGTTAIFEITTGGSQASPTPTDTGAAPTATPTNTQADNPTATPTQDLSGTVVSLQPGTGSCSGEFTVDVVISGYDGANAIGSYAFTLTWPGGITYVGVADGTFSATPSGNPASDTSLNFTAFNASSTFTGGTIATVTLDNTAGVSGALSLSDFGGNGLVSTMFANIDHGFQGASLDCAR